LSGVCCLLFAVSRPLLFVLSVAVLGHGVQFISTE